MNKATRTKIEKWTIKTLTEAFGPPVDERWMVGKVSIWPIFDETPWLACRYHDASTIGEDGYRKPRLEIDWPSWATYPSGKYNLHSSRDTTFGEWTRDVVSHLMSITEPGTPQRDAVEFIEFETV